MNINKILAYTVGPVGTAAIGFITIPIMTWFYSIEDIGRVSMLPLAVSLSIILFTLGLDQAYVRGYYEASNRASLLKYTIFPGLILVIVFYSFLLFLWPNLISEMLYDVSSVTLSIVTSLCFILAFISRFLSLILRMEERALAFSMSQLIPKLLFLLFVLGGIWLGLKKNIYNLIFAHTLSFISIFLVLLWNTRHQLFLSIKNKINYLQLKSALVYGFPLMVGGLAFWTLSVTDKLSLRYLSSFKELGLYTVAMSIAGVVAIFSGIFNTIWSPLVYKWMNDDSKIDVIKIENISFNLLAVIYFVVVISGLFSWILIYFLPKQYYSIQYIISICLFAPLLYTLSEVSSIGIAITRKTYLSMIASVLAMILNLLTNYILVPPYGAVGAAFSTTLSFLLFYVLRTELSRNIWYYKQKNNTYFLVFILFLACSFNLIYYEYFFDVFNGYFILGFWFILLVFGMYNFRYILMNCKRV